MKKIKIKELLSSISIVLFLIVLLARVYFNNFSSALSLFLLLGSNIILLINIIAEKKIQKKNLLYVVLCLLMLLPSFYNNAYLDSGAYKSFFMYVLTITYGILLYFSKIDEKKIDVVFNVFLAFAILTSIVTWISFINPSFYITNIISLLPTSERSTVINDFTINGMRMGLSNHYSRNAFYIMMGIIAAIYKLLKNKDTKITKQKVLDIGFIVFLFMSLFLVGKRAHLLFIIFSIGAAYFLSTKLNLKSVMKILGIAVVFFILSIICINVIPGTETIINRLFNFNGDFTSGRLGLYKLAWEMFEETNYSALGWGQFAKATDYYFAGVHNDYLQLLCEVGIIGFTLVVASNIVIFVKSLKLCKNEKSGFSFCVLVYNLFFLAYSMTGIPHYDIETYMTYFLLNSLLFYCLEKNKKNKELKNEKAS